MKLTEINFKNSLSNILRALSIYVGQFGLGGLVLAIQMVRVSSHCVIYCVIRTITKMAAAGNANCFPEKLPFFVFIEDFLFTKDDELMEDDDDSDDLSIFGCCSVFSRRNLSRICHYFEITVPSYQPDVFRSHFRLSRSTFELLCRLIVPTETFLEEIHSGGKSLTLQNRLL